MQDTGKEKKSCFGCSVIAVCGWLVCAAMCLWLTIYSSAAQTPYGTSYCYGETEFSETIFTSSRCAGDVRRLLPAVIRVCFGEGTMLLLVWLWGRYWLAA